MTYESEFNSEMVEKMNRQLKLGYGPGFRPEQSTKAGGMGSKPWMTTTVQPRQFDKDGTVFREAAESSQGSGGGKYLTKYVSRAAALAARYCQAFLLNLSGMF